MEIFFLWIALAIGVGMFAAHKGRSGFGFFLLALLLSPVFGFLIALAVSPNRKKAEERQLNDGGLRKCPFCAELIKKEAIVCKHCGRDMPDQEADGESQDEGELKKPVNINLIVLLSVTGFLVIYAMVKWI